MTTAWKRLAIAATTAFTLSAQPASAEKSDFQPWRPASENEWLTHCQENPRAILGWNGLPENPRFDLMICLPRRVEENLKCDEILSDLSEHQDLSMQKLFYSYRPFAEHCLPKPAIG